MEYFPLSFKCRRKHENWHSIDEIIGKSRITAKNFEKYYNLRSRLSSVADKLTSETTEYNIVLSAKNLLLDLMSFSWTLL